MDNVSGQTHVFGDTSLLDSNLQIALVKMINQLFGRTKTLATVALRRKPDALDSLRMDHMRVEALFLQIRIARDLDTKLRIFQRIKNELTKHMRIEESIFYPACREVEELRPMVAEAYEEHQEIKTLLKDMSKLTFRSERMEAKLTLLVENVEYHISEEEDEFFPQVSRHFSAAQLERLSSQIRGAHLQKTRQAA